MNGFISKEIVIGDGDREIAATAIHYDKPDTSYPHISQNKNSYWVNDALFDGSEMVVFKNTIEGENIALFLKQQSHFDLKNYLERLLLTKAPLSQIHQWMIEIKAKSFEQGKENLKSEIKNLLSLKD